MHGKNSGLPVDINLMSFEEKLKLLPQEDKEYLNAYMDRVLTAGEQPNRKSAEGRKEGRPETPL